MKIYSSKNGENLIKFNVAKVRILMKLKPHKYKYLVGTPLRFSAGSEKSSVLGVHDFSGSAEKAKYLKIMTFARS